MSSDAITVEGRRNLDAISRGETVALGFAAWRELYDAGLIEGSGTEPRIVAAHEVAARRSERAEDSARRRQFQRACGCAACLAAVSAVPEEPNKEEPK